MTARENLSKCDKCYKVDDCMLTLVMIKHCLGPFADTADILIKIRPADEKIVKSPPIAMSKAFEYRPDMPSAKAISCADRNPLLCQYSVFLETGHPVVRVIGCRLSKNDQLCPFPCDKWR